MFLLLVDFVLLSLFMSLTLLLNILSLLLHLINHIPIKLLFVIKSITTLLNSYQALRLLTLSPSSHTTLRADTDVLSDEVLRGKILHIVGCEFIALLLWNTALFLLDNFVELVADEVGDVLECLRHTHLLLLLIPLHIYLPMLQVRIKLARNLSRPIRNLITD